MIDIIKNIFGGNGFKGESLEEGILYRSDNAQKTEYWLVISCDITNFLERQNDFFNKCKKIYSAPSLDKNISLLLLWKTAGNLSIDFLKEKVMAIEEDPYLFKKYVLYYSPSEQKQFQDNLGSRDVNDFISKNVSSREMFDVYKNNPHAQTWQSLLYRISIKLPFISIAVEENTGLHSLFEVNKIRIKKAGLTKFNDVLLKIIDNVNLDDMEDEGPENLFSEILSNLQEK